VHALHSEFVSAVLSHTGRIGLMLDANELPLPHALLLSIFRKHDIVVRINTVTLITAFISRLQSAAYSSLT